MQNAISRSVISQPLGDVSTSAASWCKDIRLVVVTLLSFQVYNWSDSALFSGLQLEWICFVVQVWSASEDAIANCYPHEIHWALGRWIFLPWPRRSHESSWLQQYWVRTCQQTASSDVGSSAEYMMYRFRLSLFQVSWHNHNEVKWSRLTPYRSTFCWLLLSKQQSQGCTHEVRHPL